jgi:leucyl-tRNA synthetase
MINYKEIEQKWQKAWQDAKAYEPEVSDKESLMVFAAEPYLDMPQHVGHLRTYGTADVYARYMRMKGMNVLYPMCFHATGTPVLAIAKRLQNNDESLIKRLKAFHVSDKDIEKMKDPSYIAEYFRNEMKSSMQAAGYGIDWRREFVSIDPIFMKMVEWQFLRLKDKGYLKQGRHPVGWCTKDNSAVGQHDTRHDVQPELEALVAVKFKDAYSDIYFACATYRPETVYGVTNIFVGENVEYVVASVNGVMMYLSKDAATAMSYQASIKIERDISVKDLLSKRAINPVTKEEVPIFPGYFVKSDVGTGIVMSVPSHAPFDYIALQRLSTSGVKVPMPPYKKLISVEGDSSDEIPALAYLNALKAGINSADDIIESATKQIYNDESRRGVMLVGKYQGRKETEAREGIKKDLLSGGDAFEVYQIANEEPVFCRCGTRIVVKIVEDQWFINYGDKDWKNGVHTALSKISIYPRKLTQAYVNTVDWLDMRAAERAQGLGTKFPFNQSHVIESLSDSTIYMSFFTYVNVLKSASVSPEQLKPEFFDYVINSIGSADAVSSTTGIDIMVIKGCKESFDYWYRRTSSHSGPDLVNNHLTMYLFNHVALFPEKLWPKQIVTNGFINYEGEKMSKSIGSVVPLSDGVAKFGADPLRLAEITAAEIDTDTEFSLESVNGVISRNEFLYNALLDIDSLKGTELEPIDYWLYSRMNRKIEEATEHMDRLELKSAYIEAYFNSIVELKYYLERGGHNQMAMRDYLESVTLMIAPIMPHLAEEFWHALGKSTLAAKERWPTADRSMINEKIEHIYAMIDTVVSDIAQTIELTSKIDANKGKSPKSIKIIIADDWKRSAYNALSKTHKIDEAMRDPSVSGVNKEVLGKFLSQFMKRINSLSPLPEIKNDEVFIGFAGSRAFLSKRFGVPTEIELEGTSKSPRASRALPDRPSLEIIWG